MTYLSFLAGELQTRRRQLGLDHSARALIMMDRCGAHVHHLHEGRLQLARWSTFSTRETSVASGGDAETLLISIQQTDSQKFPFGVSLDLAKAFDSFDWQSVIPLMRRAGVPETGLRPLTGMWSQQQRWCTYGGAVPSGSITHIQANLLGSMRW